MGMRDFFEAQKANLRNALQFEPFGVLLSGGDRLYELTIELAANNPYGRFVLMCHKSFLTAASLIGQAQPDDADPITRRAIEMIRVAAATKEDRDFYREWIAFEQRHARWQARQEGRRPEPLRINITVRHPIVRGLMETYGILSDASVHFTPEYFATLRWEHREGTLFLHYLTADQRAIENAILLLTGTHLQILRVLDFCLDAATGQDNRWASLMQELFARGRRFAQQYNERYGVTPDAFEPGTPGGNP